MQPDVVVEISGTTGIVRLNRPSRSNSVTPHVLDTLGNAVEEMARQDTVKAIVLTGTGKVFCAGADIREMDAIYRESGAQGFIDYHIEVWWPSVQKMARTLWYAPKPVVAAINGAASGGGLDFSLACDLRIAASSARFAESYVKLGMVPVAGGAFLLPQLIGLSAATEMLASGELIDADRALALGLVNEVCATEELLDRAVKVAELLSSGPVETFTLTKEIVRQAATGDFEVALDASLRANTKLVQGEEVRSKILAMMEKYRGER